MNPCDGNVAGFSFASCWLNALNCSSATAFVTPGASRMIAAMNCTSVRLGDNGSHTPSLPYQPNRGGMTPTMVWGLPFSRIVRPTADGSPSNSRSHSRWLRTTTGSAWPSGRMSVGWMVRPVTGGTPRKLNAFPDIRTPRRLSGANSPDISTLSAEVAITSPNAGTSRRRFSSSRK